MESSAGGGGIAVIGGGPAGFMAALASAEVNPGLPLTIFDAGVPLATVLRTGGGRCNLTNAGARRAAGALSEYPRGGKFLPSAFSLFGPAETMSWFRSKGLELVEEEGGRVFPRSGRADDVRRVLSEEARRAGIRVRARAPVERVTLESGSFAVQSRRTEVFDRVVIATGGDWRDREGSGYRLARSLGHAATALAPSLTALKAKESWAGRLAGLTLPAAGAAWRTPEGRAVHEEGDLLFTHRGISGPLAFRVSARCAFLSFSAQSPLLLSLSVQPGSTNVDQLEQKLLALVSERPRQQLVSAVRGLVPRSLAEVIIELAGLSPESAAAHLPREGRKRLAALAARLPLAVIGREPGTEMVTAGGIALDEVDPRTMGSRLVPGLHFCGEVLDIDGFTGGWNLQAAWTTGRLAGLAIAR